MGPFLHTRCSRILGQQASKTSHDITLPKLCPAARAQCEGGAYQSPTTANFSTSIALCVYLPQEGSYGISHELCVGEVARRSRGSMHRTPVCFCILVFASETTRSKDDTKFESLPSKHDLNLKMVYPVTKLLLLVHQPSCPISDRK